MKSVRSKIDSFIATLKSLADKDSSASKAAVNTIRQEFGKLVSLVEHHVDQAVAFFRKHVTMVITKLRDFIPMIVTSLKPLTDVLAKILKVIGPIIQKGAQAVKDAVKGVDGKQASEENSAPVGLSLASIPASFTKQITDSEVYKTLFGANGQGGVVGKVVSLVDANAVEFQSARPAFLWRVGYLVAWSRIGKFLGRDLRRRQCGCWTCRRSGLMAAHG